MSNGQTKARKLSDEDFGKLTRLLANQAAVSPVGVKDYFEDLLRQAPLSDAFRQQKIGTFRGQAGFDARGLVDWAQTLGRNPHDRAWTTLGSLLRALLESETLGLDAVTLVAGVIESYGLCLDPEQAVRFRAKYGVPDRPAAAAAVDAPNIGPEIDWQGSTDRIELQSWLGPEPTDFSLSFLQSAVHRARSVCKVEFPNRSRSGSGVLVAPDLILTNHHVVFGQNGAETDTETLAKECVVSFGGLAGTGGAATASGSLDPATDAIVASSKVLDYALLRLSTALAATQGLDVASMAARRPAEKDGVNLLHHPRGESMRVSMSDAGVTRVLDAQSFVQYITRSAPGSSGAPCFDDDWNLAALHHAERSRPFGRVGEGILIEPIRAEIQRHLG